MTPEQKRDNDTLSPFDPSSRDVHPASRVRLVLRLNGSAKDDRGSRDESYSEDSDVGESELDDDSDASVFPVRKSTRLAGANSGSAQLPFSPKKTRSRKVIILGGDEETDDNDDDIDIGANLTLTLTSVFFSPLLLYSYSLSLTYSHSYSFLT